jgi:3-hydroxyacyl-[acyl-carrier-protein] dehydratase
VTGSAAEDRRGCRPDLGDVLRGDVPAAWFRSLVVTQSHTVAAELLFDLAPIDLSRVMISAAEVGRLNPQSGPMRQLDHIVWHNDDFTAIVGLKQVRPGLEEFWAAHHIPGRPMMPGVLMIEAAAQLSSIVYRKKMGESRFLGFTRCDDVIFRGQVVPGDTLLLLGNEIQFRPRRMISRTQGVVRGQLVFEATITGMVL